MNTIISKTPLRVSFVGGGTDLPWFYQRHGGAVISTTIDKYVTVRVSRREDRRITVNDAHGYQSAVYVAELRNPIVRESMRLLKALNGGIDIDIQSDVVSSGTGLGTSSALTVGLLNALHGYRGQRVQAEQLAQEACIVELNRLQSPIGKQDQYAAAHGGLKRYNFQMTGEVTIGSYELSDRLERVMMLFRTNIPRASDNAIFNGLDEGKLIRIKELVSRFVQALFNNDIEEIGGCLEANWELKRRLNDSITNATLDDIYDRARKAGALGGKLLGAGGGGYFLFVVRPFDRGNVIEALRGLAEHTPFRFEPQGSRLIDGNRDTETD